LTGSTLAWRKIVVLLASAHDEIPAALGYPPPSSQVRGWARAALDRIDGFSESDDLDLDRFWESDDADGVAGTRMASDLEGVGGRPLVDAVEPIAALLSLPDDRGLRGWANVLWGLRLRHPEAPNVPLPNEVADRLAEVIASSNERRVRIRTRTPGELDEWEWAFLQKHDSAVEAETFAYDVLELRATDGILKAVAETFVERERQALEAWASAELASYERSPRPPTWTPVLRLPTVADQVTLTDAD
jgi:hypothetical protein